MSRAWSVLTLLCLAPFGLARAVALDAGPAAESQAPEAQAPEEEGAPEALEAQGPPGPGGAEEPAGRFSEQVVVAADPPAEEPAALPVQPARVLAVAGGGENVFRTLQALPGVAATEEFGSRLSVRGGGPDENLTLMDGVEIHNPYRLFGLTSAFNPETVERFDLSSGGFGARYGDRLSSLLLVETRDGAARPGVGGSASLALTDANVILEGGLLGGAAGSWLLTARRTYYDLVADRITGQDLPSFGDVQGRLSWELAPGRRLTLSGLSSREGTDAAFEGELPDEGGLFVGDTRNDVLAATLETSLGGRGSSRTTLAAYRYGERLGVDARVDSASRRANVPEAEAVALASVAFERELELRDLSLRQEFAFAVGRGQLVEAGVELHGLRTRLGFVSTGDRNPAEANGSSVRGGAGLPDQLDSSRDTLRAGLFVQDRIPLGPALQLEPGLRLDWSGANGEATLQPRLAATLGITRATRLRGAFGLYTQSPGYEKLLQADYLVDLGGAERLSLVSQRAWHAILGLERELERGLFVRAEAYYKDFDRLLVGRLESETERAARLAGYDFPTELAGELPVEPLITTQPANQADGSAYGLDLFLERRRSSAQDRLSGWVAYSFGRARRDSYGVRSAFDYDRRHALSLVGSLALSRRFDLALTARIASGFPRTPALRSRVADTPDALDADADGDREERIPARDAQGRLVYVPDFGGPENLNSGRLPTFARVDLRATFHPGGRGGRWQLYVDVINALGRENASRLAPVLEYDPASDRPRVADEPSGGLPLLPSFGVRFRF